VTARRINRGRGHSYELDGQKVISITRAIGDGIPKQLSEWAAKLTARKAVDEWDELAELPPTERLDRLIAAHREARNSAGLRGTRVHGYAQDLAAGEEVEVPDEYRGHVDAYLQFAEEWQPRELLVERPFFSRTYGYAGTPDLVADLIDGCRWLLDWKTSESGIWPDFAVQLAAARFADFALDADDRELPVPELGIERAGCVWLRADGYDLIPVAADVEAFGVFLRAKAIAEFVDSVKRDRERWVGDALLPNGR